MNTATIEHLFSRLHPKRRQPPNGEPRYTMLCRKCNNERNEKEQSALPVEEKWKRSGRYPKKGIRLLHIGRKAPDGWHEENAIHLGSGIWMIVCRKNKFSP